MLFIELNDLRFYSFHGIHEEEKILGNEYEVCLKAGIDKKEVVIIELQQTVDYTALYTIISQHMAIPTPLLETVIGNVVAEINEKYPGISQLSLSIKKLYPPVNNFIGNVEVSFEWEKPG